MKPATTQKVIMALLRMFSSFGIPRSITADNGPQFRSTEFHGFCSSFGIHLNLSTPYWPEQNGAVERQMRNLGRRVKISCAQGTDWKTDLHEYITLYHSTPQDTTGLSPGRMMFGREIRSQLPSIHHPPPLLLEEARDHDMLLKQKHKERSDDRRSAQHHKLVEGDIVVMRNLKRGTTQPNFGAEEFKVLSTSGAAITVESNETGKVYTRNSTHFKKLFKPNTSVNTDAEANDEGGINNELVPDNCRLESEKDAIQVTSKRLRKRPVNLSDYVIEV